MSIALVDYGAGNLTSVRKALTMIAATFVTPGTPADLSGVSGIIVPGVGHFQATQALDAVWREQIRERVAAGVPLLGICLGLQWLFEGSEEAPDLPGLGVLPGRCVKLDPLGEGRPQAAAPTRGGVARDGRDGSPSRPSSPASAPDSRILKIPHVGWNALDLNGRPSRLLEGVDDGAQAYFTHSFVVPETNATVATTEHGVRFPSVVERGLVFGAQCHPEKSGDVGLQVLRNFLSVTTDGRLGEASLPR